VSLAVDGRLTHGSTRTGGLDLAHEFGLLILSEEVTELLVLVHLFVNGPKSALLGVKEVRHIGVVVPVVLVFEKENDRLPFSETVVARVGHHHKSTEDIHLSLEHLHGQAYFALNLSLVN